MRHEYGVLTCGKKNCERDFQLLRYGASYSYRSLSIPLAAQVGIPSLPVTSYSYRSLSIPMAARVGLPGLPVTSYSYRCLSIPVAAQVG